MTEQHKKWLQRAYDDLNFATLGLENDYYSQVCFLSQQCIEKCLKGYIVSKGDVYERTHSLLRLCQVVPELNIDLAPFKKEIRLIDKFYIPTRYPDGVPGSLEDRMPSRKHAKIALKTAQDVYQILSKKLN